MRQLALLLVLSFLAVHNAAAADLAAQRAKEFAIIEATTGDGPGYQERIVPEYWHPLANDSGLTSSPPSFLPPYQPKTGVYLVRGIDTGTVVSGKSPFTLEGKQPFTCVEIVYEVVGEVARSTVTLYSEPRRWSVYYAMAIDEADGKWKFVESYPYLTQYYRTKYFLENWKRLPHVGSLKNLEGLRTKLEALNP